MLNKNKFSEIRYNFFHQNPFCVNFFVNIKLQGHLQKNLELGFGDERSHIKLTFLKFFSCLRFSSVSIIAIIVFCSNELCVLTQMVSFIRFFNLGLLRWRSPYELQPTNKKDVSGEDLN